MESLLTPRVQNWKQRGHTEIFREYSIHCFCQEGQDKSGPLHVICHGYPTCSFDWKQVIDQSPELTILTFDFLGFGLSDKPPQHNYTLTWQADLVEELITRHNKMNKDLILIGHDMGTSVVAELLARDIEGSLKSEIHLMGAFLFNGSMFMERANLILGQKILRSPLGPLASKLTFFLPFRWQLGSTFSRTHPLSYEEAQDQWTLMSWKNGYKINDRLIKYTFERVEKAERWLGSVRDWEKPIAYVWGMQDPVCGAWQLEGWKELRPNANLIQFDDLGHYPQIENSTQFTEGMKKSLEIIIKSKKVSK